MNDKICFSSKCEFAWHVSRIPRCLTEREQHAITEPLTFGFQLKSIIIIIPVYTRALSVIPSELGEFRIRSKTFNLNSLMRTRAKLERMDTFNDGNVFCIRFSFAKRITLLKNHFN